MVEFIFLQRVRAGKSWKRDIKLSSLIIGYISGVTAMEYHVEKTFSLKRQESCHGRGGHMKRLVIQTKQRESHSSCSEAVILLEPQSPKGL
jgi:hypothetical protein